MHPSRKLGRGKTGCNGEAWGSGRGRVDNGHRDFARLAADVRASGSRRGVFGGKARRNLVDASASESEVRLWLAEEAGKKPQPVSDGFGCIEAGWALIRVFRSGLVLQDRRK